MKKAINIETVEKIARLARLRLTSKEAQEAEKYLADILAYVDTLSEVDVEGRDVYAPESVGTIGLRSDRSEHPEAPETLRTQGRFNDRNLLVTKGVFNKGNDDH